MSYEFKEEAGRFVAMDEQGNQAGEVTFTRQGDNVLVLDHTGVEENHRGQGLAGQLVRQVVDKAKSEDLKISPTCPYAKKQFEKNEDYQAVQYK
ncbi:N-acetyltransferase [Oceanobacillus luteolus]|uniref:GNAT family N-acetyltransferase n=1 Tax=Oceanobacillus luteolus TaxID=1274358 RepID=A0ABW4HWK5_9BACI|nr:GNAT family N-acetyltransferase [Oceanobacillus luteolus]MCM3740898.1 N-acetyltransferase [Oceanobacillus luteolus]